MDLSRTVEQIKTRIDIVDFISDYLELKKAGRNFKGLCPFHAEKSPSFTVSPERQMFHCFGCGAGGDIVGFMMKEQNINFPQAVTQLAERAGVVIENNFVPSNKSIEKRKGIFDALEKAREYFIKSLNQTDSAKVYLKNRGLTEEIIKEFSIGFAPRTNDLYKLLKNKGFSDTLLASSGVIASGDHGLFDMFRGRIIFPIVDIEGRVIAFGGRVTDDGMPKYLNSPDTDIFHKGHVLYGLYFAKENIRKRKYAIVVEGYMDAVVCHMLGINNVVAPLGTALTESHVKLISRYARNILVVFDGDSAGINAAKRSLDIIYREGLSAKVLLLPDKNDPDSFLRSQGVEQFRKLMKGARSFIDFRIDVDGKNISAMRDIYATISNMKDAVSKGTLITELAEKAGISETILRDGIKQVSHQAGKGLKAAGYGLNIKSAEEILLSIFFNYTDVFYRHLDQINLDNFESALIKKIFIELLKTKDKPSIDRLTEICDSKEINYVSGIVLGISIDDQELEQNIVESISKIKKNALTKEIDKIDRLIQGALNDDEEMKYIIEKQRLLKESFEGSALKLPQGNSFP
ncbi:MAG: DNA primase [Nitrospirae bacterium]|nr:DNA primase [Nitrospirota bacterium]